ncbi:MAG: hypothetical protein V1708_05430, partial [Candidatus Micrarchaeota archaeon]
NANSTGGFNFAANHTGILIYQAGNASGAAEYLANTTGVVSVNVSAVRASGIWNNSLNTTGNVTVTIGVAATVTANVSALSFVAGGANRTISVSATDAQGNALTSTAFNWTSNSSGVSAVASGNNSAEIVVNGTSAGQALITVFHSSNAAATDTIVVTVSPSSVATAVTANETSLSFAAGSQKRISVTATDVYGNALTDTAYTWTSNSSGVSAVVSGNNSATIVVNGILAGQALVTVFHSSNASAGANDTIVITVSAGVAQSVSVNATSLSVAAGGSVRINVSALDASGNSVPDAYFNWTSNSSGVSAVVSGNGTGVIVVNGTLVGQALITVFHSSNSSATNTTTVTVSAGPIVKLDVNVTTLSLTVGGYYMILATGKDAWGNANNTDKINYTWSPSSASIANVTAGNLTANATVYAVAAGTANVNVTYQPNTTITNVTAVTVSAAAATTTPSSGSSSSSSGTTSGTPSVAPTPTPAPEPTATPQAEQSTAVLDDSSSVTGVFGASSATFTLSYTAPSGGFQGDVTFRLPFSFADYTSGRISLSPTPDEVREGSIIAVYKNRKLSAGSSLKVTAVVSKSVPKDVLSQFTAPTVRKTMADDGSGWSVPSVAATAVPAWQQPAAPVAAKGGDYTIWIIVALVFAAAAYFIFMRKEK